MAETSFAFDSKRDALLHIDFFQNICIQFLTVFSGKLKVSNLDDIIVAYFEAGTHILRQLSKYSRDRFSSID